MLIEAPGQRRYWRRWINRKQRSSSPLPQPLLSPSRERGGGSGGFPKEAALAPSDRRGGFVTFLPPPTTRSLIQFVFSQLHLALSSYGELHISNIANVAQYSSIGVPCHRLLKMRWIVVIAVIDFNNQAVKLQRCAFLLLRYLWGLAGAEG